jgi:hypothetical protein
MLKRVHIKGFRSCQDVLIDNIGSMTALIGRNGSGKTNILRAIEGLARMATATDLGASDFGAGGVIDKAMLSVKSVQIDIERDSTSYRYTFEFHRDEATAGKQRIGTPAILKETLAIGTLADNWQTLVDRIGQEARIAKRPEPIRIGRSAPCLPVLAALLPSTDNLLEHIRCVLRFLHQTWYYPFDVGCHDTICDIFGDSSSIISESKYQDWVARSHSKVYETSISMRLLQAYRDRKPQFREILSLLGDDSLGLIKDISVLTSSFSSDNQKQAIENEGPALHMLRFRLGRLLGGGSQLYEYNDLSLGTRRVLHIITRLVLDTCALMLIEHPEDGIHPGLLKKRIDVLRANVDPVQIILSSHSAEVFNRLKPEDIRLVSIHRGATSVRSLTRREASAAARFVGEDGTLADFLETVQEG